MHACTIFTLHVCIILDNLQWLLLNRDISDQVCIIILRLLEDMFMEIIMCRYFVIELPLAMSV